ncbi:16S rRNA (cytidine(1402)-2'-O)-methyltransferase [Meiothermus sp. QL-1]|uniref:16S rRNA (cytidine(1402)-2'-O)-methyltransferase n=1 Tax=Meiothermus sp. QL-1 TaxID=2058095 RepID=UPI000E0A452B|nr:16S rRNA (cytidine(1402)-2'-O)-methyltransferase [Meiothermus sp. QL-1]RDI96373.1 16S rRNA (cytidine(1402)-2'-O)-methyltransferase [Meiothermus sp. QL-1]
MRLVLVPTPIGNLEDITLRAIRELKEAEVVACEDTRRTGVLLKHLGISKPLLRLDQHTIGQARKLLQGYGRVAYVTDAGTPGISDPGAELVALALQEGWQLEVLPGPTALIPALVASGLPTARFAFEGFLPQKRSEREARLKQVAEGRTVVLYEAPHRLRATLEDLVQFYGPEHPVAVARELSKAHEEVWRGTLAGALAHFQAPRGEFVLVLGPKAPTPQVPLEAEPLVGALRKKGLEGKALVRALVEAGIPRNQAYALAHQKTEANR